MIKTFTFTSAASPAPIANETRLVGISRHDAFACMYEAYAERIHRIVFFRVADEKLAEEISAQVFVEAWEQLPAYQTNSTPILAWLYKLTEQAIADYERINGSTLPPTLAPIEATAPEAAGTETLQLQTLSAPPLYDTPAKSPQTLILGFIGELSPSEIARELDKQRDDELAAQLRGLRGLVRYLTTSQDDEEPVQIDLGQRLSVGA